MRCRTGPGFPSGSIFAPTGDGSAFLAAFVAGNLTPVFAIAADAEEMETKLNRGLAENSSAQAFFCDLAGAGEGHRFCSQLIFLISTAPLQAGGAGIDSSTNSFSAFDGSEQESLRVSEAAARGRFARLATAQSFSDIQIEQTYLAGSPMGTRFMGLVQYQTEP